MGIKQFIERRTCPKCNNGVLLPYSWKVCMEHDPSRHAFTRGSYITKKIRLNTSIINRKLYGDLVFKCDKEKALNSDMLMYDENMHIIGYRSPLFKLKE